VSGAGTGEKHAHHQPETATSSEESSAEGALVLVVEDERPIAEAIRLVVEDAGYTALLAYNGRKGLELAHSAHPALITTDYMMPGLNGGELIAALRTDAANNGGHVPPIIMISAITSPQIHRSGYDRFLEKPFDIEDLTNLLHLFLRREQPATQRV
jgi:DNA-binding response OmpR family regulator